MDILIVSISIFGWFTGTCGLVLAVLALSKAQNQNKLREIEMKTSLDVTEERLKSLLNKKILEMGKALSEQAREEAADVIQNVMSVESFDDPFKTSTFKKHFK